MADYVCEGCIHAPPGSGDGKPCCMCDHDFTELTCWYMPKYCPNCGAPIADEAVEMVLKRMEEIYK